MKIDDIVVLDEDLRGWFRQKWVDISRKEDGKHPACGASAGKGRRKNDPQAAYPKCVPAKKAASMSAAEKKSATRRKREVERGSTGDRKEANMVSTKVKK